MDGTKKATGKTVMSGATHMDMTRDLTRELVRRAEWECGSRMGAYERVGQSVGMSAMWVRKLVHGYGDVRLLHVTVLNIQEAYRRLCERVEMKAENERLLERATLNAVNPRTMGMVARLPETEANSKDGGAT